MTRDEAVEMAMHVCGGAVLCDRCHREPHDEYMASAPGRAYDDVDFGRWLVAQGWRFEWEEHDREGGPRSGRYPFLYYPPQRAGSLSWSFRLTCPRCPPSGPRDNQPLQRLC